MSDKPILFSGAMVRAILRCQKHQTRRVVKPQPTFIESSGRWKWPLPKKHNNNGKCPYVVTASREWFEYAPKEAFPYHPGDTLYVKESFRGARGYDETPPSKWGNKPIWYCADGEPNGPEWSFLSDRSRPSIFMPRWASRITLRVTSVRVERLCDISESDAIAEGMEESETVWGYCDERGRFPCQRCAGTGLYLDLGPMLGVTERDCRECDEPLKRFRLLWDSINAKRAPWKSNPWIWAIAFERVEP